MARQADMVIYCEKEKSKGNHGDRKITVTGELVKTLKAEFGEKNVSVIWEKEKGKSENEYCYM